MNSKSEEKKFKLGYWAGLIGGVMLVLTGVVTLVDFRIFWTFNILFIIPPLLTLLWGILALFGVFLLYGDNENGDYLLILSGALSIYGMFFPFLIFKSEQITSVVYLSYTFGFIDPFIILFGGIIDFLLRNKVIWS